MNKTNILTSFPLHPIGIGTFMMGGDFNLETRIDSPVYDNDKECIEAIRFSIDNGQNHIDTAIKYGNGHTDELVSKAISYYDRSKLFIADKIPETHLSKDLLEPTLFNILKLLDTDYLDLLYVHNMNSEIPISEYMPIMDSLVDKKYIRGIGLSNLSLEQLKEAIKHCSSPIEAIQVQYNILDRNQLDPSLSKFCKDNDIAIVAYQPLQNKIFFNGLNDDRILKVVRKYGMSIQQLALNWLVRKGLYPIPKAIDKKHILENLKSIEYEVSEGDIKYIDELV